ncbi:MAG TPA: glycoside hydrolase family 99-like domain-containing protein, partial [Burkholderiales bacterium]|nr:glycoside hydrolase family 99-like domain-containing protein [Burkholderiales bacterium]
EQRAITGSVIAPTTLREGPGRVETFDSRDGVSFERCEGIPHAPYFIALASNAELPIVAESLLHSPLYMQRLEAVRDSQSVENSELREKNSAQAQESAELRERNSTLTQRNAELHRQGIALLLECAELRQQNSTLTQKHAELRGQGIALLQENAGLRRQSAELEREFSDVKAELSVRLRRIQEIEASHVSPLAKKRRRVSSSLGLQQPRLPRALAWQRRLIAKSHLFDAHWYLDRYADVQATATDPLTHYLARGAAEGRHPNPFFDINWYLQKNPDVAANGINPLLHYLLHGAREGRDPSPLFASSWYLQRYEDVRRSGLNPLAHYLMHGRTEGRAPHPRFDVTSVGATPPRADVDPDAATGENAPLSENYVDSVLAVEKKIDGRAEWAGYQPLKNQIATWDATRLQQFAKRPPQLFDLVPSHLPYAAQLIMLPKCGDVDVSIIIPVFNNVKLTLECLLSISKTREGAPTFEVIVADDASSDATFSLIPQVENVVYVRNSKNLGFLRNCNNAAKSARGRYLLFLNNDVQVTDGWLSALVRAMQECPNAAAVGPKILFPDGSLQEAGAFVDRDGHAHLIGCFDDPTLPRFNYRREVDYCSGACLLVERSRFGEVGGFSDELAPAYCEDLDLCFKLRQLGLHTIYEPNSVIVHHLSRTTAHHDNSYKMRCITTNQQKIALRWQAELGRLDDVKVIAFYLPQYHPIPENDRWWGRGFTEWRNVARATPQFPGHYQPRLPADLGYYDLRVPEVMNLQAALARKYGIHGFCYYYYNFAGKRLLEMPIERMLTTGEPDFPFCLCWANENWTRRWDGEDAEVLIAQEHSEADDIAAMRDLMRYFRAPNYIRIRGKPLLLVYRVKLFPDFARTARNWRELCRREGIGEIFLAMVEVFELSTRAEHPAAYGCDAVVEFPPHGMSEPLDANGFAPGFEGVVYDYLRLALSGGTKPMPGFARFPCVAPGWDNSARRKAHSHIFVNDSPGAFQAWLEAAIQRCREQNGPDHRFVFINAWNEWAEGAYLEPDQRLGHANLEALRNALERWQISRSRST